MKAIVAMTRNRVIGYQGKMPWHLPEDFRWFKAATTGHVLVLGRKTFESIGRPLPNRLNVVITRGAAIDLPGVVTVRDLASLREADFAPREVWVAGGAEIYAQLLPQCTELYVSVVEGNFPGDTFFPAFEPDYEFVEVVQRGAGFAVHKYRRK